MRTIANLATEVYSHTKKMKFVGYDLNKNGPHALLDKKHPNIWLSAGNQRDKIPLLYRGEPDLEDITGWLASHAYNKFKIDTTNLKQKYEILNMAQEQGILDHQDPGKEKPKNIMDEIDEELKRRGEL